MYAKPNCTLQIACMFPFFGDVMGVIGAIGYTPMVRNQLCERTFQWAQTSNKFLIPYQWQLPILSC